MYKKYSLFNVLGNKTLIFYFTLFFAIIFSYFAIANVKNVNIKGWKGYHILLVEKSADNDSSIYRKLQKSAFFDEIISEYNTEVAYSNYNSLSYITVDKIEKRFKQQDPRLDNYIRNISGYFKAHLNDTPYSVYYLKTEAGYKQTYSVINFLLEKDYNWTMLKYKDNHINTILLFIYILIISIFIYNHKKQWFLYLLHAVPWVFLVYFNGKSYFFTALFMLFILMVFLLIVKKITEEYINSKTVFLKKYLNKKAFFIIAITIFSFILPAIVSNGGVAFFITPIFMLLFELFFILSQSIFTYCRVTGYSHRVFYATRIKKDKNLIISLSIKSFAFIYFLSILTLPLYFLNTGNKNLKYPVPVTRHNYPELGLTLEFLTTISLGNVHDNYLPDYCEYIKHLAYQMRLPYKTDYSIPLDGEEITISNYYLEKNNYKMEKIRVDQFTDIWLKDNITINKENGITSLMLSGTGIIQAESGAIVPDGSLFIVPLIYVFLYPILFYSQHNIKNGIKKPQFYGIRKKNIPVFKRRKQQAA